MLNKRFSRGFILAGLSLAFLVTRLFVSNSHISFLFQFIIALTVVTLLASFIMQAFSLARWKRMLVVSLLIISAVAWYVYPGLTTASIPIVASYQELIEKTDVIVIGHLKTVQYGTGAHHELCVRVVSRTPKVSSSSPDFMIYSLTADEYIAGDGPEYFTIFHGNPFVVIEDYQDIPEPGEAVVIFLKDSKGQRWQPATVPFMFTLVNDTLHVQSNIPEVIEAFPPITLTELTLIFLATR